MQGTLAVEVDRHPMWSAPKHTNERINTLRQQIKRSLIPFDGRTGMDVVIDYVRNVYLVTEARTPNADMIGGIIILRVVAVARIESMLRAGLPEQQRINLRQQIKVLTRLSDEYATALAQTLVQR